MREYVFVDINEDGQNIAYLMLDGRRIAKFDDHMEAANFEYYLKNHLKENSEVSISRPIPYNHNRRGKYQQTAHDLEQKLGSNKAARHEIARQLRIVADHLETNRDPMVFGCELLQTDKVCEKEIMETISVTLSHPWGG